MNYATASDVIKYRPGLDAKTVQHLAEDIIPICSSAIRLYAKNAGINLDQKALDDEDIASVLAKTVVDASVSYMNASESNEPLMTQFTQSVGGYSVSGSYANVGNGFYFAKSALMALGIKRQRVSTIEVFGNAINC